MNLEGDLAKIFIDTVRPHIGHAIVIAQYGKTGEEPVNLAVECETCNETLIDADLED